MIFGIVSTFIAFYIDTLDDMRTDGLLDQKGVVMVQNGNNGVTYDQGNLILNDIIAISDANPKIKIESYVIFQYVELDPFIRLYSMDISKPWQSKFIKPSLVVDGKFPDKSNEILVP
ncbi:MAG: hypothetical protein ACC656_00930, partial [Candidatus Heimdallarchaeota archaeon]